MSIARNYDIPLIFPGAQPGLKRDLERLSFSVDRYIRETSSGQSSTVSVSDSGGLVDPSGNPLTVDPKFLTPPELGDLTDMIGSVGGVPQWTTRLAQQHKKTADTVGLWQLDYDNGLTDSSGNGLTLTALVGTAQHTEIMPGLGGMYFDGGTIHRVQSALLQILGDFTWQGIVIFEGPRGAANYIFSHMANGETEATNFLYSLAVDASDDLFSLHEYGAGTNAQGNIDFYMALHRPYHITYTRYAGRVYFGINGKLWPSSLAIASNPTGGSSGYFMLGGTNFASPGNFFGGYLASVRVLNTYRTEADMTADYNATLGPALGRRT